MLTTKYHLIQSPNSSHQGVGILVKRSSFNHIILLQQSLWDSQTLICRIQDKKGITITVVAFYNKPDDKVRSQHYLTQMLGTVDDHGNLIVAGDFNLPVPEMQIVA